MLVGTLGGKAAGKADGCGDPLFWPSLPARNALPPDSPSQAAAGNGRPPGAAVSVGPGWRRAGALVAVRGEGLVGEDEGNPACAPPDPQGIQEAGRALGLGPGPTPRPPRLGLGRVAARKLLGLREVRLTRKHFGGSFANVNRKASEHKEQVWGTGTHRRLHRRRELGKRPGGGQTCTPSGPSGAARPGEPGRSRAAHMCFRPRGPARI